MNKQTSSKVALVTGSSRGIGAGIAKYLGIHGYTTVVTYKRDENKADEVVRFIHANGGEAVAIQLDVTSEESVKNCFGIVDKKFGRLDALVNNAGVDRLSPIESVTFKQWQEITRSKIDGNFLCTKYALPLLKKVKKSDVIAIMSDLGDKPDPEDSAYSVGTAGVVCFVKAMAVALAKYGVRTNGVGPSATRTEIGYWKDAGLHTDEAWEKMAKDNPLGRVGTVEDVAKTVLAVIENPTQFWNGNFVYVTGGSHIKS